MKLLRTVFPLLTLWALAAAAAAGSDSASTRITLTIPPLVSISQLEDIDLGAWAGEGDLVETQPVCVWSSIAEYSLTASSAAATQQGFALTAGSGAPLPYQVFWNDGSSTQQLVHDQQLQDLSSSAANRDCADGAQGTANLTVHIPEEALDEAPPGSYHDTLTLTIASE